MLLDDARRISEQQVEKETSSTSERHHEAWCKASHDDMEGRDFRVFSRQRHVSKWPRATPVVEHEDAHASNSGRSLILESFRVSAYSLPIFCIERVKITLKEARVGKHTRSV